jgi:hypothetical protein
MDHAREDRGSLGQQACPRLAEVIGAGQSVSSAILRRSGAEGAPFPYFFPVPAIQKFRKG